MKYALIFLAALTFSNIKSMDQLAFKMDDGAFSNRELNDTDDESWASDGEDPHNTAMIADSDDEEGPVTSTPKGTYDGASHEVDSDGNDSDASHAGHKRAAKTALDESRNKKAPFSPGTNRRKNEAVNEINQMKNTPKKTREKYAAQAIVTELPKIDTNIAKRFKERLNKLQVPSGELDRSTASALSDRSTVDGSPGITPLDVLQQEIGPVAHEKSFSSDLKDHLENPDAAQRVQTALKILSPPSRKSKGRLAMRFMDREHLEGDAHGGGHLVEDQNAYQAYVVAPTQAKWGVGPKINPETGVTSAIYQGQTNPKPKHSTLFPRGMKAEDVWNLFKNSKDIAKEDNRSLEVGTTTTGIKIHIEVHRKAKGVMNQTFPIWSLKDWREKIPGITARPEDILTAAKESYSKFIRPQGYDPIRYGLFDDKDKNIVFDVAPMEGNQQIPKGAYVTIPKELLEK